MRYHQPQMRYHQHAKQARQTRKELDQVRRRRTILMPPCDEVERAIHAYVEGTGGKTRAAAQLHAALASRIRSWSQSWMLPNGSHRDPTYSIEDAMQEAWLAVFTALETWDRSRPAIPWLEAHVTTQLRNVTKHLDLVRIPRHLVGDVRRVRTVLARQMGLGPYQAPHLNAMTQTQLQEALRQACVPRKRRLRVERILIDQISERASSDRAHNDYDGNNRAGDPSVRLKELADPRIEPGVQCSAHPAIAPHAGIEHAASSLEERYGDAYDSHTAMTMSLPDPRLEKGRYALILHVCTGIPWARCLDRYGATATALLANQARIHLRQALLRDYVGEQRRRTQELHAWAQLARSKLIPSAKKWKNLTNDEREALTLAVGLLHAHFAWSTDRIARCLRLPHGLVRRVRRNAADQLKAFPETLGARADELCKWTRRSGQHAAPRCVICNTSTA